ncbi:MAG: hypothetical protein ACOH5I_12690 [Oligoflexus sp.]
MNKFYASIICTCFFLSAQANSRSDIQHIKTVKYNLILRNLNPMIGSWYILHVQETKKKQNRFTFHIEVPADKTVMINLHKIGLQFNEEVCPLWENPKFDLLAVDFSKHTDPYFPICEGTAFIRLAKPSNTKISSTESISRLLRQNFESGEKVINLVKPYLVSLAAEQGSNVYGKSGPKKPEMKEPTAALVSYKDDRVPFAAKHQIGINLKQDLEQLAYGKWYETEMHQGIYVSLMTPEWITDSIKSSFPDRVNALNNKEADKLAYLIAYDLDLYQAEYVAGLQQPGIRNPNALQKQFVPVGNVPAYRRQDTVGVFIGGFQQRHGRIKRGPHKGKVYGYTQNGVTLENLSPGLATFISTGKRADIISWSQASSVQQQLVSARQNGVPIIENSEPHALVKNWGWGNWSGDSEGRLQSIRSAICIQNQNNKRYLIFAAFTSATPSSMAKVLQSYQCQMAMHLDMNAYMYVHNAIINYEKSDKVDVEYLHQEMEYPKGLKRHRYILDNNERDFFYVYRKASL